MELEHLILHCYSIFYGQNTLDEERGPAADTLLQIYSDINNIPVFLNIIKNNPEKTYKDASMLSITQMIQTNLKKIEDKNLIFGELFEILRISDTEIIISNSIYIFQMLMSDSFYSNLYNFLSTIPEENPQVYKIILDIFNHLFEYIGFNTDFIGFYDSILVKSSILPQSTQISAFSFCFRLLSTDEVVLEHLPSLPQIYQKAIESMTDPLIGTKEYFENFSGMLLAKLSILDPIQIIQSFSKFLELNTRSLVGYFYPLIGDLLDSFPEILQSEYAMNLCQALYNHMQSIYYPEDSFDMSPHVVVEPIAESFASESELMEIITSHFISIANDPCANFFIVVFILYSLENGIYFYPNVSEDIINLLIQSMSSPYLSIKEASIKTISAFIPLYFDCFEEYSSYVQIEVLQALMAEPIDELFDAFPVLMNTIGDSDCIFDIAANFFIQLIDTNQNAIKCLSSLIKNSKIGIQIHYQEIFQTIESRLSFDSPIVDEAVYCMAQLSAKCHQKFAPFAPNFAQYLLEAAQKDNIFLQIEAINAYGYLLRNQKESTSATINQMIQLLVQLSSQIQQNEENYVKSFRLSDISLQILCCAISEYPEFLSQYLDQLVQTITGQNSIHAAIGTELLARVIDTIDDPLILASPLIEHLFEMIKINGDFDVKSKSFDAMSMIITTSSGIIDQYLDKIIDYAIRAFQNDLFATPDNELYDQSLLESAQMILREVINVLGDESYQYLSQYLHLFVEIAQHPKKEIRNLAIQLLGEILSTSSSQFPDEILQHTYQICINEIENNNYIGFYCMKKIILFYPMLISQQASEIYRFLIEKICSECKKSESIMMMQDNCISCLGALVMNIYGEQFQIDNSVVNILELMPPQMDVEEKEDTMNFYIWLHCQSNGQFASEFLGVLIRFFSEPPESIQEGNISEETIQALQLITSQHLKAISNIRELCNSYLNNNNERSNIFIQNINSFSSD